jgi:type II secretory pathway pseudopilin PulG
MDKIPNDLLLLVTIIISSIILGSFFFAIQLSQQRSIERQQEIRLQDERKITKAKFEQAKKVGKRIRECYEIYLKEKKNLSNVTGFKYSEVRDICIVHYASTEPAKTAEECQKIINNLSKFQSVIASDKVLNIYYNCLENYYSKEF